MANAVDSSQTPNIPNLLQLCRTQAVRCSPDIHVGSPVGSEAWMETVGKSGLQPEAVRASDFSTWAGTAAHLGRG